MTVLHDRAHTIANTLNALAEAYEHETDAAAKGWGHGFDVLCDLATGNVADRMWTRHHWTPQEVRQGRDVLYRIRPGRRFTAADIERDIDDWHSRAEDEAHRLHAVWAFATSTQGEDSPAADAAWDELQRWITGQGDLLVHSSANPCRPNFAVT